MTKTTCQALIYPYFKIISEKLDNNLPEYENVKTTKIFKSVIIFLATAKWFQFFQISNYVNQAKVQIGNRFDLIVLKENQH